MSVKRISFPVTLGPITLGGGAPVVVQSMTDTETANIEATADQCYRLWQAGSELVRITVNTKEAARSVPFIRDRLIQKGWEEPLLVGDFHYIGHQLLTQFPSCADALAKYRINPGNVGFGEKQDKHFTMMVEVALKHDRPVRIGVNGGSLDQALVTRLMDENARSRTPRPANEIIREALVQSALHSADRAEALGMPPNKIVLSCKVSQVEEVIAVYQILAARCQYALHVGLTEAGMGTEGIVSTAAALAILLREGIGDTIRASLTPLPGGDRTEEVRVCQALLQALGLRAFRPRVTACPGCGRTTSQVFQILAQTIQKHIEEKMPAWQRCYPGVETLKVAVMGCVVNGPGESKQADIGISLPGTGEQPAAPVFIGGKKFKILRGEKIAEEFIEIMEEYIAQKFDTLNTLERVTRDQSKGGKA